MVRINPKIKCLLLAITILIHFQSVAEQKRILLISSYNSGFPTFFQQIDGIKSVLDPIGAELNVEFMDNKRFLDSENIVSFKQRLGYKFKSISEYDAIITTDDDALNFVLDNQDTLFKTMPVIFCGVNDVENALQQNSNKNVTGIIETVSMKETIDLLLRLFPKQKRIYAITDNTASGQADFRRFSKVSRLMPDIEFLEIAMHKTNFAGYKEQLSSIPSDIPVLLLSAYHDSTLTTVTFKETMTILNNNLNAPLFHLWEHGIGNGILGGKVISHYEQGKSAAMLLDSIWNGADISTIKVSSKSPNIFMFDYKQLKQFGINENKLPKASVIINKQENLLVKNKGLVVTFLIIFVLLIGFIVALSTNILERRKIEIKLKKQNLQYLTLNDEYKEQNKQLNTAKKLAEENESRFRHLFENNPVSLWEEDFSEIKKLITEIQLDGKAIKTYLDENPEFVQKCAAAVSIIDINQATLDLFEYSGKEELKSNLPKTFNPKSFATFKEILCSIAEDKPRLVKETEYITKSGRLITAILYIFSFKEYAKSIITIIDSTAIKQTEQNLAAKIIELQKSEDELKKINNELILAKEQAEESDRLKSAFLANMSHEIRTPMNGILGFTELLATPQLTGEQQQNFISIIKQSGQRMLSTINDIIDISKIHAGQVVMNYQNLDIINEIDSLIDFFIVEARGKNLELTYSSNIPEEARLYYTDKSKLNSILTNLIKNAIKYTDQGSIKVSVSVQVNTFFFSVKDTGIGIPPDRVNVIFDRFVQADVADIRAVEGAGLGLAITKSYVEMLGGKIRLNSILDKGSEFSVELPFTGSGTGKTETPVTGNKQIIKEPENRILKILIAEDDENSFKHLEILFHNQGWQVYRTKDGNETVEIIKDHPEIDLILMDIRMPGIDGLSATMEIRKFNPEIKIIAQTAFAQKKDEQEALQAGCDLYIKKPINKSELFLKINSLL